MNPTEGGACSGWRLLPFEIAPPATLVNRSAALLDDLAEHPVPTLRWYRSTAAAVVLGRGQRPPAAAPAPTTVLGRGSGGGAVLLDPDLLSLDVALPAGHPWLDGRDLTAVFIALGDRWRAALERLGAPELEVHPFASQARRRGSDRERLLAAVCFATLGRGEVHAGGRKVLGLSQRHRRHAALVQCGLLLRWRPASLLAALGADPHDPEVHHAAVGLWDLLGRELDPGEVMAAVTGRLTAPAATGTGERSTP